MLSAKNLFAQNVEQQLQSLKQKRQANEEKMHALEAKTQNLAYVTQLTAENLALDKQIEAIILSRSPQDYDLEKLFAKATGCCWAKCYRDQDTARLIIMLPRSEFPEPKKFLTDVLKIKARDILDIKQVEATNSSLEHAVKIYLNSSCYQELQNNLQKENVKKDFLNAKMAADTRMTPAYSQNTNRK